MKTQRTLKCRLILAGVCLLAAGCPLLDKAENPPPGGRPGGRSPFPQDVVEADGLDSAPGVLASKLLDAATACGWQSGATVPGGWHPVMVSSDGCTQWIPPNWAIHGRADSAGFSPDAGRRTYAFTLVNPLPSGYPWDADEVIDFIADSIAVEFDEEPPSVLWRTVTDVADLEVADAVFAFFLEGEVLVGSLRVHFGGCEPDPGACFALVMGYWLPVADLEEDICDVVRIDASLGCPGLGACVAPICSSWCVRGGADGGLCEADTCGCY